MIRVQVEAETGHGEDWGASGERYAIACDGLGGQGRQRFIGPDGREWKEGKVASFYAVPSLCGLIEARLDAWTESIRQDTEGTARQITGEMETAILEGLRKAEQELQHNPEIPSVLPTTAAMWVTFPAANGRTLALAVWAGDSRCYSLDGDTLRLFTEDDAVISSKLGRQLDAMEETFASSSPAMTNRIGMDKEWHLNHFLTVIEKPTLLFVCTDGAYGGMTKVEDHIASPMHMEYLLRRCGNYESIEKLNGDLSEYILDMMDDDSATVMSVFVGGESAGFAELCAVLKQGLSAIEEKFIAKYPKWPEMHFYDINDKINKMRNTLAQRPEFENALCAAAERIVTDAENRESYPALESRLTEIKTRHRTAAERYFNQEVIDTEKEIRRLAEDFDQYVSRLFIRKTEARVPESVERAEKEISRILDDGSKVSAMMDELCKIVPDYLNTLRLYMFGDERWYQGYLDKLIRSADSVDKMLYRLCYVFTAYLGHERFMLTQINVPEVNQTETPLSERQKQVLKEFFLKGKLADGETVPGLELSLEQYHRLNSMGVNTRDLKEHLEEARAAQKTAAASLPLTPEEKTAIRGVVKSIALDEAKKYLEDWLNLRRKPDTLASMPNLPDLDAAMRQLMVYEKRTKDSFAARDNFQTQALDLWQEYKAEFEAWKRDTVLPDDLFVSNEPAENETAAAEEQSGTGEQAAESEQPVRGEQQAVVETPEEEAPAPEDPAEGDTKSAREEDPAKKEQPNGEEDPDKEKQSDKEARDDGSAE